VRSNSCIEISLKLAVASIISFLKGRLVRASQKDLNSINEDKLDAYGFVVLMFDNLEIGGRTVMAASGTTAAMEKIPVGLREGDTENSEVVKDLLASIQEWGFTALFKWSTQAVYAAGALPLVVMLPDQAAVRRALVCTSRSLFRRG
jgi:hypothetical protein